MPRTLKLISTARRILLAASAVALLVHVPTASAARDNPDTREYWEQWQPLSKGYVGRRKVPANANKRFTERRLPNVEERLDRERRLAIRNLRERSERRDRFEHDKDGFGRRQFQSKNERSGYRGGRDAYSSQHRFGRSTASKRSEFLLELKRLEKLFKKRTDHRRKANRRGDLAVWLRTGSEGLYSVSIEDLAAEVGRNVRVVRGTARLGRLSLTNAGRPVAWYYDESSDEVLFAGEGYETFYTDENAYRLSADNRDVKLMGESRGRPTRAAAREAPFPDTLKFEEEPDFFYATWSVASEPDADYWWWDYLYGGFKDQISVDLHVPDPAPSGLAQLRATLRGWTDLEAGDEHQVYAELNGVAVGPVVTWDGFEEVVLTADFDQSLLDPSGDNELVFRNIYPSGTHPGQWLDKVAVDYIRRPVARDGMLWLHEATAGVQTVSGFAGADILVIESPNGDAVLRGDARVDSDGSGGYSVTFEASGGDDYVVVERAAVRSPLVELDEPSNLDGVRNGAEYLIIAPRALEGTAEALATYRRSRFGSVQIAWLEEIYDEFSHGREDPFAVGRFMEAVLQNWRVPPGYVVVVGKGTVDHKDRMGYSDSFVPAVMIDTPWSLAASDYRLLAGDGEAGFTFGRIPVISDEDGLAYVDKLKAYESTIPGSERYQAVLAADNPDAGGEFHANSDLLADRLVDSLGFEAVSKFYHPQDPVRQNLILSATWDAGYVSYDGHGSASQVGSGSENFIKSSDADALRNTAYPVFSALTCAAGDYTLPGSRSLAGSLVLNPAGGAIASLSPTGLSLDSDAQLLNNAFVDSLFGNNVTVGEAIKQARLQAGGVIVPTMPRMYNIIGDPGVYAR